MHTQDVLLGERSYPLHVGSGVLREAGALLAPALAQPRVVIISNAVVSRHWLAPLTSAAAVVKVHP